ncbi:hypothetical protein FQA39_LY01129 [Lamprigera yunnana]|nr:hypothetical protein FQA39_LY01129 [Lamprigera yunnana]
MLRNRKKPINEYIPITTVAPHARVRQLEDLYQLTTEERDEELGQRDNDEASRFGFQNFTLNNFGIIPYGEGKESRAFSNSKIVLSDVTISFDRVRIDGQSYWVELGEESDSAKNNYVSDSDKEEWFPVSSEQAMNSEMSDYEEIEGNKDNPFKVEGELEAEFKNEIDEETKIPAHQSLESTANLVTKNTII